MKILQIFGWVVAIHLVAFFCIFASPGCSSSPRNVPKPDATVPSASSSSSGVSYNAGLAETPLPADRPLYVADNTPGRATPTRPGSPNAAAIAPTKPAAQNVSPVTSYTIQKGDSLWIIAKKNHITVAELTKANNLTSSSALRPGKKLLIPGKPISAAAPVENAPPALTMPSAPVGTPAEAPARSSGELTKHIVASGESLGTIARKYQVTVGELAKANNITDPAKIRVGQPLVIPGAKHAVGKTTNSPASKPTVSAPAVKPAVHAAASAVEKPAEAAPQSEIKPPPPGQDLDAGLKENTATDVPTIKVEESKPEETTK
jgi:LysM repeat protein